MVYHPAKYNHGKESSTSTSTSTSFLDNLWSGVIAFPEKHQPVHREPGQPSGIWKEPGKEEEPTKDIIWQTLRDAKAKQEQMRTRIRSSYDDDSEDADHRGVVPSNSMVVGPQDERDEMEHVVVRSLEKNNSISNPPNKSGKVRNTTTTTTTTHKSSAANKSKIRKSSLDHHHRHHRHHQAAAAARSGHTPHSLKQLNKMIIWASKASASSSVVDENESWNQKTDLAECFVDDDGDYSLEPLKRMSPTSRHRRRSNDDGIDTRDGRQSSSSLEELDPFDFSILQSLDQEEEQDVLDGLFVCVDDDDDDDEPPPHNKKLIIVPEESAHRGDAPCCVTEGNRKDHHRVVEIEDHKLAETLLLSVPSSSSSPAGEVPEEQQQQQQPVSVPTAASEHNVKHHAVNTVNTEPHEKDLPRSVPTTVWDTEVGNTLLSHTLLQAGHESLDRIRGAVSSLQEEYTPFISSGASRNCLLQAGLLHESLGRRIIGTMSSLQEEYTSCTTTTIRGMPPNCSHVFAAVKSLTECVPIPEKSFTNDDDLPIVMYRTEKHEALRGKEKRIGGRISTVLEPTRNKISHRKESSYQEKRSDGDATTTTNNNNNKRSDNLIEPSKRSRKTNTKTREARKSAFVQEARVAALQLGRGRSKKNHNKLKLRKTANKEQGR